MRQKLIALAAAALCLLFSGCAEQQIKASDLDFQFDCKAEIRCPGENVTCSFQRMGPQDANLRILSGGPEGLAWNWSGNGFTMLYEGLAASGETCTLPGDSFAPVLVSTLDQAAKPGSLTATRGNEFSGNDGCDYLLTADPKTGKILTLSVPEYGIKANFYDYAEQTLGTDFDPDTLPD